jgi:hypothetical protein
MSKLSKDLQLSENSALVTLVYDFLDEVAEFESDEYEVHATVTHDVVFTVDASSEEEAEDAASCSSFIDFYDCDASQSNIQIDSVSKADTTARDAVDIATVTEFITRLLTEFEDCGGLETV